MGWIEVIVVSAMPISEIRGGLPLAIYYGFNPLEAYVVAFVGNTLPIPFLLVFLDKLVKFATKISVIDGIYRKIVARVDRRRDLVEKYGYLGLTLFVAIPLPVTGAWTGTLLAFLLGLNKLKSFVFISAGICIAGLIVLLTSLGVISLGNLIQFY
jgi:uncharacterized membrane protein